MKKESGTNSQRYLNDVKEMNETYEYLLKQMKEHGFDDTYFLLRLAHLSFTQDILNEIQKK